RAWGPPRLSTVLKACAETRSFTERPSASDINVTFRRLGRNRRLVLRLEWLTLWPTSGPLPVNAQRRDIATTSGFEGLLVRRICGSRHLRAGLRLARGRRTYSGEAPRRQAKRPGRGSIIDWTHSPAKDGLAAALGI